MDASTIRRRMTIGLVVASLAAAPESKPAPGAGPVPAAAWSQAHVQGKYRGLLRQLRDPESRAEVSDFKDDGWRQVSDWKGYHDLPPGYWVYVHPFWYIWREATGIAAKAKVSYGAEQAVGPPDTPGPGDQTTAWASATPDQQPEWLELEFATAVVPSALKVHETCAPGALTKVTLLKLDGSEEVAWSGRDPTPSYNPMGVSVIPITSDQPIARVRLHIDSSTVPGFNEIDAVGLVDAAGKTQWAVAAQASTTFGQANVRTIGPAVGGGIVVSAPPTATATATRTALLGASTTRAEPVLTRLASDLQQSQRQYAELKQLLEKSREEIKALRAEIESLKRRLPDAKP